MGPEALLAKATGTIDESNLPESVLNVQQADRFIDLVIDSSILLKNLRTIRVNHNSGEINKLDIGEIVSEDANEVSVALNRPTESKVTYANKKVRSAFDLVTDFVEDNLEGSGVRDTLMNMFTKRIAIDAEILAIEGDDSITGTTKKDKLLKANDGFNKILRANVPAAQQVDAAGAASSRRLFYDMKRKIQQRYRVAKPDYRWVTPSQVWDKWELDEGEAPTLGSEAGAMTRQQGRVGRNPFGMAMFEVPLFPEDLTVGTTATDASDMWLTPLMNLLWFIQRDITIEWDRVPRADKWEVTIHYRTDVEVENELLVVISKNISESGTDYTG